MSDSESFIMEEVNGNFDIIWEAIVPTLNLCHIHHFGLGVYTSTVLVYRSDIFDSFI
jgi:hypothetical protein